MPSLNIRRNDTVKVLTGTDRGKTGRVLRVFPDKGTVLVADSGGHRRPGVTHQCLERHAGLS
ncbi:MAG: KOW motif-containing protein [Terracidiphilus sp.]